MQFAAPNATVPSAARMGWNQLPAANGEACATDGSDNEDVVVPVGCLSSVVITYSRALVGSYVST